MDLRAFKYKFVFVFLLLFLGSKNSFAFLPKNDNPLVPYEIKFADITFQLNDVTRYLIQIELKNIQANQQNVQVLLGKMYLFLPIIEPILKTQNVPDDFKYLVNYNKYQSSIETSTSLENGILWCLDKDKAEDVDLVMNSQLDERKHLIAATQGSALCFKRNQVLYKNWATTLFSHIADKKVLNLLDINRKWSGNAYILLDSPAYSAILQFLAYKISIEREFPAFKPSTQQIIYEYPFSIGKSLSRISAELKVEPQVLKEYNQWLTDINVPDTECKVLVVVAAERYNEIRTLAELSRNIGATSKELDFPVLKSMEINGTNKKGGIFYKINDLRGLQAEMCDIVVTMAYKAGISIEKFVEYNDMKESDLLHVGQIYYTEKKRSKASVPFHVVREGETLWDISQMYAVRLENLLDFNRLETVQRLQRGRVVWLQTARPKNKPIEYIEAPDELALIDKMLSSEKVENKIVPILVTEENLGANTNKQIVDSKEIDLNTLPLYQEIGRGNEKNNVVSIEKKAIPNEIDINTLPLSQEIRKEHSKVLNLSKDVDSKAINSEKEEETKVIGKGEKVKVDNKKPFSEEVLSREKIKTESQYIYHTVRKDETLFRISVNYNVSVENLWKMNNLSSTIVASGTVLKIKRL